MVTFSRWLPYKLQWLPSIYSFTFIPISWSLQPHVWLICAGLGGGQWWQSSPMCSCHVWLGGSCNDHDYETRMCATIGDLHVCVCICNMGILLVVYTVYVVFGIVCNFHRCVWTRVCDMLLDHSFSIYELHLLLFCEISWMLRHVHDVLYHILTMCGPFLSMPSQSYC